jgi:hypothetical protein
MSGNDQMPNVNLPGATGGIPDPNTGATNPSPQPADINERMQRLEEELVALRAARATTPSTPSTPLTAESILAQLVTSIAAGNANRNRTVQTIDKPKHFDGTMGESIHDFIMTYEAYF